MFEPIHPTGVRRDQYVQVFESRGIVRFAYQLHSSVSDKGMPAALFMALTHSLLLAEARRERSPRSVLTNVHRLLIELGEPDMFVTVFYGVVDVASRRLTVSS
jgi:serine phosphatase RsbU (regulator of sigma subunit)